MGFREDIGRRVVLGLLGITLLAFVLRVYHLDFQSLWSDEIYSIALAAESFAESLKLVAGDVHPPLYFLLLHIWLAAFGNSEFSVRMLSVLPSVLAVPVLFRLGWRLLGVRAGVVAAAICAVSTFQIYYAQEARSYALTSLLAILSMDAFSQWYASRSRGTSGRGSWLRYVAVTSALLYTHYFGIFVVVVQNAWLIGIWLSARWRGGASPASAARARANGVAWLAAQLAIVMLFAAWIPVLLAQVQAVGDGGFWIREPGSTILFRTLLIAISLHRPPWGFLIPWAELLQNFLLFSALFGGLAYFFAAGKKASVPRERGASGAHGATESESWALLGLWLVLPALLAFALSALSINIYTHRNLIISSPALFLLIGAVFARLPGRVFPTLLLAASLAPSVSFYSWHYGSVHKGQWREMTAWLGEEAGPDDGFVFDAPFIRRNFDFYRGARDYHFIDARQRRPPRRARIWLVRAHQDAAEHRIQNAVEAWGFGTTGPPKHFRDIQVFLYERQ